MATLKWFIEICGTIESYAAIDKDGTIYIASTNGRLMQLENKIEKSILEKE